MNTEEQLIMGWCVQRPARGFISFSLVYEITRKQTCHRLVAWEGSVLPIPPPPQSLPPPPPKCLGSKHDVTHMALTLSHDLEQPRRYLFSAPLPSGHGLKRWAVLCKYDLVGVNVDPGCMALQHVPGLPVNNSLQNSEDSKFGFQAMTIRPCRCFRVFEEKLWSMTRSTVTLSSSGWRIPEWNIVFLYL